MIRQYTTTHQKRVLKVVLNIETRVLIEILVFSQTPGGLLAPVSPDGYPRGNMESLEEGSAARHDSETGEEDVSKSRVDSRHGASPSPQGVYASDAGLEGP